MNRRLIIIAITVLVILAIGMAVLWMLQGSSGGQTFFDVLPDIGGRPPTPGLNTPTPVGSALPSSSDGGSGELSEQKLLLVVEKKVLAPALSGDQQSIVYVLRDNGHIVQSDIRGQNEQKLSNLTILETFDAQWSPIKDRITLWYPENNLIKKFLEITASGTPSKFLPDELTSFSWSPDGKEFAYLVPQSGRTGLVIADQNNRNPKTIFSTPISDFMVRWITKNTLLLVSRPSGEAPSLVMQVTRSGGSTVLDSGRQGIVITLKPDGTGYVFSQGSPTGGVSSLMLHNFSDGSVSLLPLETIADKCAFSSDSKHLFCGVPRSNPGGTMPDAWYQGAVSFSDRIVGLDLATNQTKTIMESEADVDAINLFATTDQNYLFFQDKKTGHLWRLMLQ